MGVISPPLAQRLIERAEEFARNLPSEKILIARNLNSISGSEILIRTANTKGPAKKAFDWIQTKRGDVVVPSPMGWKWGSRELAAKFWRILVCPDIPLTYWRDWTVSEYRAGDIAQKRKFYIDLDAQTSDGRCIRAIIALTSAGRIILTKAEQDALKRLKRERPSPFAEHVWQQSIAA